MATRETLSYSLAISAVADLQRQMEEAEETRLRLRIERDDAIRNARAMGVRYRVLCQVTGLSRMQLDRIVQRPEGA